MRKLLVALAAAQPCCSLKQSSSGQAPQCDTSRFANVIRGVQCRNFEHNKSAVSSHACKLSCCESAACSSWVWSDQKGCWVGRGACSGMQSRDWHGASQVPVVPLPGCGNRWCDHPEQLPGAGEGCVSPLGCQAGLTCIGEQSSIDRRDCNVLDGKCKCSASQERTARDQPAAVSDPPTEEERFQCVNFKTCLGSIERLKALLAAERAKNAAATVRAPAMEAPLSTTRKAVSPFRGRTSSKGLLRAA